MLAFIVRRIISTIPVMAFVALFVFSLLYIAPGDPAAVIAGDQASPADVERIRASLGLGSSSDDVTRLVDAVNILVSNQRDWKYAKTAGAWNPVPETRPFLGAADDNAGAAECV